MEKFILFLSENKIKEQREARKKSKVRISLILTSQKNYIWWLVEKVT
jgi:hypothetical protein